MQPIGNVVAEGVKILLATLAVFGRVSSMQLMARRRKRRRAADTKRK